jgi:hypothetical protein
MRQQGHDIQPLYHGGTDVRLNGTWTLTFDTPVWQWYVKNYEQTNQ